MLAPPQNMVMSFRVSDLQMLLGFVGRSKSGLKHELVTRALQLVQFDCSPELFKKIKELYETRYAKKNSEPAQQPHRPLDPLTMHSTYDRASAVPRTPLAGPNIDYPVLYGKYLNGLGRLPAKTLKPEVRLVKLPFFNMLDELLKPTELGEWPPLGGCDGRPHLGPVAQPSPATQPTLSDVLWRGQGGGHGGQGCPSLEAKGPSLILVTPCCVTSYPEMEQWASVSSQEPASHVAGHWGSGALMRLSQAGATSFGGSTRAGAATSSCGGWQATAPHRLLAVVPRSSLCGLLHGLPGLPQPGGSLTLG